MEFCNAEEVWVVNIMNDDKTTLMFESGSIGKVFNEVAEYCCDIGLSCNELKVIKGSSENFLIDKCSSEILAVARKIHI